MAIKISFRSNQPPVILKPQPITESAQFKGLSNHLPKRGRSGQGSHTEDSAEKAEEILAELDDMIGLNMVKKFIHELQAFVDIQKKREKEKLLTDPLVLHMLFSGNPGSGKTTVARLVSKMLKEMGVLEKGHLVECDRADLVGEYIGHTANKTRDLVKSALGGVLFIDEAYSLARGGEKDFGKEAIDCLVRAMENHKDNLILILAGYRIEMDYFINSNPGLRSRFPIHIDFPDYSLDELAAIGELMLAKREYEFTPQARIAFRQMLQNINCHHPYSGNARMVRNIIEKTIRKQAVRLFRYPNPSRADLIRIEDVDLSNEEI